jgi:hypothetical protein
MSRHQICRIDPNILVHNYPGAPNANSKRQSTRQTQR